MERTVNFEGSQTTYGYGDGNGYGYGYGYGYGHGNGSTGTSNANGRSSNGAKLHLGNLGKRVGEYVFRRHKDPV